MTNVIFTQHSSRIKSKFSPSVLHLNKLTFLLIKPLNDLPISDEPLLSGHLPFPLTSHYPCV